MGKVRIVLVICALAGSIMVGRVLGEGPALFGQPFEDEGSYVVLSQESKGSLSPEVITRGKLQVSQESPLQKLLKLAGMEQ